MIIGPKWLIDVSKITKIITIMTWNPSQDFVRQKPPQFLGLFVRNVSISCYFQQSAVVLTNLIMPSGDLTKASSTRMQHFLFWFMIGFLYFRWCSLVVFGGISRLLCPVSRVFFGFGISQFSLFQTLVGRPKKMFLSPSIEVLKVVS